MKYLVKISDGYIYPYTEILSVRNDMREPTQDELNDFFGLVKALVPEKKETKAPANVVIEDNLVSTPGRVRSDEEVLLWAELHELELDKNAISDCGVAAYGTSINRKLTIPNMLRKLIELNEEYDA